MRVVQDGGGGGVIFLFTILPVCLSTCLPVYLSSYLPASMSSYLPITVVRYTVDSTKSEMAGRVVSYAVLPLVEELMGAN